MLMNGRIVINVHHWKGNLIATLYYIFQIIDFVNKKFL